MRWSLANPRHCEEINWKYQRLDLVSSHLLGLHQHTSAVRKPLDIIRMTPRYSHSIVLFMGVRRPIVIDWRQPFVAPPWLFLDGPLAVLNMKVQAPCVSMHYRQQTTTFWCSHSAAIPTQPSFWKVLNIDQLILQSFPSKLRGFAFFGTCKATAPSSPLNPEQKSILTACHGVFVLMEHLKISFSCWTAVRFPELWQAH